MTTRSVTGVIRKATGDPWPAFTVTFVLTPSTATLEASYPHDELTSVTDAAGAFSAELVTNVRYRVELTTLIETEGVHPSQLPGAVYSIIVPDGDGPISLERLRMPDWEAYPVPQDVLDAVVAAVEARLIPPGGVTGQALVKAAAGDYALTWGTADAHFSEG